MTPDHVPTVSGPWIGSAVVSWLMLTCPTIAVVALLELPRHKAIGSAVVGIALAMAVMSGFSRRVFTVQVSDDGIQLSMPQRLLTIPWEQVVRVERTRISGIAHLNQPIAWGRRSSMKFTFVRFDPRWEAKATAVAVLEQAKLRGIPIQK